MMNGWVKIRPWKGPAYSALPGEAVKSPAVMALPFALRQALRIPARLARLASHWAVNLAFLDQVVTSGGNFLCGVLLARTFGTYEFGRFALAWMLVEFMGSLQFAAIIQPMLNIGSKQAEADRDRYYHAVISQQGAACALLSLLVWAGITAAGWLLPDLQLLELAVPLCTAIIAYQLYGFFRRYLFARGHALAALCSDVLRFTVQIAATVALPFAVPGATAVAGIWVVAAACAVAAALGFGFFGRFAWNGATFRQVTARHWTFSKWLLPSALMFWMTSQAFVLMSGVVLGAAATGVLKAAITITNVLNLLLLALDNFAPVQASRAFHVGGNAALRRYIAWLAALTGGLIAAAVTALNIAPDYIVHVLYGGQYDDAGHLVRWLCAPAAVYGIGSVLVIWAAALERTRAIFFSYAAATAFTAIAAYPLTFYGGLTGVVLGSLLVEVIRVVVLLIPLIRWSRAPKDHGTDSGI